VRNLGLVSWLLLSACATPFDPVQRPPSKFTGDVTTTVQFVTHPEIKCLERGAILAASCSDTNTMTVANPCEVWPESQYSATLCHELGHRNGWPPNHPK